MGAHLDDLIVLYAFEGPARPLLTQLKYRNHRQALGWLAEELAAAIRDHEIDVDVVTWAPTTRAHRLQRGFDHAELLARATGRRIRRPIRPVLRRSRGPAQTGRSAEDRRNRGPVFDVTQAVAGKRVLVIDDVVTTGATLAAACVALTAASGIPRPMALARTLLD